MEFQLLHKTCASRVHQDLIMYLTTESGYAHLTLWFDESDYRQFRMGHSACKVTLWSMFNVQSLHVIQAPPKSEQLQPLQLPSGTSLMYGGEGQHSLWEEL